MPNGGPHRRNPLPDLKLAACRRFANGSLRKQLIFKTNELPLFLRITGEWRASPDRCLSSRQRIDIRRSPSASK